MTPVDLTPDSLSFSLLLTAAGAGIAALIVTSLVQLVKSAFPALDAKLSGAFMAFVGSAVLFFLAGAAVGVDSLDEGLVVFVAWLACATSAVGIYSTIKTATTV